MFTDSKNAMSMSIKNCTEYPLIIQLCQAFPLYDELVLPNQKFYRYTGSVHFTIYAKISISAFRISTLNTDEEDVESEEKQKTERRSVKLSEEYMGMYQDMSSHGWYAGFEHELEIHGGNTEKFNIFDVKYKRIYDC